ncbi:MAG TPA: tetratricopeptide repeat protein, partial [Gemmataceae bacterium]
MRLLIVVVAISVAFGQNTDPEPTLKQAIQLHQSGDFAKAIPLYRSYLKVRPNSPDALTNLGAALAHEGKYSEAIAQYSKALKLQPTSPQALANLGIAYYKTGQISQAREEFRLARELMAGNQQITFLLADCEVRLADYKAAIAILEPLEKTLA